MENSYLKIRKETDMIEPCKDFQLKHKPNTIIVRNSDDVTQGTSTRICKTCLKKIDSNYHFSWEFMEFCNVLCISKFQGLNFKCVYCSGFINNTLFGKFYIHTQKTFKFFCSLPCMGYYKLSIQTCLLCERTASDDNLSFSLNLYDEESTDVHFCSEICHNNFCDIMKNRPPMIPVNATCCVCNQNKSLTVSLKHDGALIYFCGKRCLVAYSFVKLKTEAGQCILCQKYYISTILKKYSVYYGNTELVFCSISCKHIYVLLNSETVSCAWCQNKRCNFDMIRKFSNNSYLQGAYLCSVNCFKLFECSQPITAKYTQSPKAHKSCSTDDYPNTPLVAGPIVNQYWKNYTGTNENVGNITNSLHQLPPIENNHFIIRTKERVNGQRNVATMCFIPKSDRGTTVLPDTVNKGTQTDRLYLNKLTLPVPLPIYVPTPMVMYSVPVPIAVPFLIPVPVPVFIPVRQQSIHSIMNDVEILQNRIPKDPCEAELLKIADMIANKDFSGVHDGNESAEGNNLRDNLNEELLLNDRTDRLEMAVSTENKSPKRLLNSSEKSEYRSKKRCGNVLLGVNSRKSLNYSLGVNALQQWLLNNIPITKRLAAKECTIVKTDILQMLPDELSIVLEAFIRELKKPDKSEYAPDTMYYLCLGIQYYLIQNGRTDNIFFDKSFSAFFKTFDRLAEKFTSLYDEKCNFIITRVEEEHLWETKQLGNHSPQVLLNTIIFFITKYYHCANIQQHRNLSFSQVLKLWRRKGKSKRMILRFCPKKSNIPVVRNELHENESDNTRCPIRLYEFYLSKCPESVKTSTTLFYLQPEQYCTSDSPVWYMSESLPNDDLARIIGRIKMIKEINMALLVNT